MAGQSDSGKQAKAFVAGALAGCGVAYLWDPHCGRRRRMHLQDTSVHSAHVLQKATDRTTRDFGNRARGIFAAARNLLRWNTVPDEVLVERVRARLGRAVSHPNAIEVRSQNGHVILAGPILEQETERLVKEVRTVSGVREVESRLEAHKEAGNNPNLQGRSNRRIGPRSEWMQENWAPATRFVLGSAGAAMLLMGSRRRAAGAPLALAGAGVLLRALTNAPVRRALGLDQSRRGIEIQKTIHIQAPLDQVYGLWSRPENFPQIMSHVREVKKSNSTYRWTVTGPAGISVSWDSVVTKNIPNQVIAWKSVPGSAVRNAGIVRFDSVNGGTRVHLRMSYNVIGGVVAHTVASLIGADPKHVLDSDLGRMKSLFEQGRTTAHHHTVTREQMRFEPAMERVDSPQQAEPARSDRNTQIGTYMEDAMKARDVMTPNPVCCVPSDTAQSVARTMCERNVGSVPVVVDQQSRKLTGIVTDRDLCCSVVAQGLDPKSTSIRQYMRQNPVACRESENLDSCEQAMQKHQIRRMPVIDNEGRCIGIIAQADLALKDESKKVSRTVAEISRPQHAVA